MPPEKLEKGQANKLDSNIKILKPKEKTNDKQSNTSR
jgi:hypothetical protein